jgi:hypothetical protein
VDDGAGEFWYRSGAVEGELTGRQVAAMFTTLGSTPNKWNKLPSPSTLHRIRATLRSAMNAAIREGLVRDNPARFIERRCCLHRSQPRHA